MKFCKNKKNIDLLPIQIFKNKKLPYMSKHIFMLKDYQTQQKKGIAGLLACAILNAYLAILLRFSFCEIMIYIPVIFQPPQFSKFVVTMFTVIFLPS